MKIVFCEIFVKQVRNSVDLMRAGAEERGGYSDIRRLAN